MTFLLIALLALAGVAHGKSDGDPWNEYQWSKKLIGSPAQLPGPLFVSPDSCKNGNGGIRDLTLVACMQLCSTVSSCQVVAWYPSWFGGSPACFLYNTVSSELRANATSSYPVSLTDQGVYVGVKKPAAVPWNMFAWSDGKDVGSPAQLPDPIFVSPDACKSGNGGMRGLTMSECLEVCLTMPQCKAMAFYPSWFKGASACFSYSSASATLKKSAYSSTLIPLTYWDKGNYLAVRI